MNTPKINLKYLERIGYTGPRIVSRSSLNALHHCHVQSVPFETLDLHLGIPIVLELPHLERKMILEGRGGFCYELNGLFAELLRGFGFDVTHIMARTFDAKGMLSPPFAHLALLVTLEGKNFLVDVGWGRGILPPLELKIGIQGDTIIERVGDFWRISGKNLHGENPHGEWKPHYQFDTAHHTLSEFVNMCNFYQYSSESHFRHTVYCGKETVSGYFDLRDLTQTLHGEQYKPSKTLEPLEYRTVLYGAFGISLSHREFERLLHGWQVRGVLEPAKARAAQLALEAKRQAQILQAQQAHERPEPKSHSPKPHSRPLEPEKVQTDHHTSLETFIDRLLEPDPISTDQAQADQVPADQAHTNSISALEEFFGLLSSSSDPLETSLETPLEEYVLTPLEEFFDMLTEPDPRSPSRLPTISLLPSAKQPFVILNGMSKMVFKIGVVGAGQMGSGIAQVAAQAGFSVVVQDALPASLERSQSTMHKSLDKLYEKGKIYESPHTVLERIEFSPTLEPFADCDLVIEAILEDEKLKLELFATLNTIVKPSGIFASNTSSIPITKLATASQRPDRFIGMHFMNPVPIMTLVEVIRGYQTSDATSSKVIEIAELMGKTALECMDSPGFVSNRILMPMINEAIQCVMEGVATPEAIDGIMKLGMNHPMGPLTLADFIGLDTCLAIMEVLREGLGSKYQASPLLKKMVQAGLLGRKSGEGFYKYP
jgi:3-hydroxybutyryl-CoA dehydrogenase